MEMIAIIVAMSEYTPRLGDVGITRTGGFFGHLIRVGTTARWNHAVIYIGNGKLVEATPRGVKIGVVSEYSVIDWNKHDEISDVDRARIANHALSLVGKSYSFITIFLIAARILGAKFLTDNKLMIWAAKREGFICSELCSECYNVVPHPLSFKPDYLVNPGDIGDYITAL